MKKFLFFFMILISSVFLFGCEDTQSIDNGYVINSYDVDVIVTKVNKYKIKEVIDVTFFEESHGIYRDIPFMSKDKYTILEIVSTDASVSDNVNMENSFGSTKIIFGHEDITFTGPCRYEINYVIDNGKDNINGYDSFALAVIPSNYATSIKNINFDVYFADDMEVEEFSIHSERNMNKTVTENHINVAYSERSLNPYEGVKISAKLNEGAFSQATAFKNNNLVCACGIIAAIVFLIAAFGAWLKFGIDATIIETPEFYPPDGLSSAEIGFIYNGSTEDKNIVASIIDLASLGCIEIIDDKEIEDKEEALQFKKLKSYEGSNKIYLTIMQFMFSTGDTISGSDMPDKLREIDMLINNDYMECKKALHTKDSIGLQTLFSLLCFLPLLPLFIWAGKYYAKEFNLPIVFIGMGVLVFGKLITNVVNGKTGKLFLSLGLYLVIMVIFLINMPAFIYFKELGLSLIIVSCLTLLIHILTLIMPKMTPYGTRITGKTRGFRNFLLYAKKEELVQLACEKPSYYFDVMGYAYALNISDEWIKKISDIVIHTPSWYTGESMTSFFASCYVMSSMHASVPQGSDVGFDGGGFGGGGGFSGGGSVGRW